MTVSQLNGQWHSSDAVRADASFSVKVSQPSFDHGVRECLIVLANETSIDSVEVMSGAQNASVIVDRESIGTFAEAFTAQLGLVCRGIGADVGL